jgi:2-(1,2-epoxy-1,2-dihydrophenyl)acetyl-CoA isomerase
MSASSYETLILDVDEGVATVTLNRPEVLNALNLQLKADLAAAIEESTNRSDVKCLLLTGAGRAFCAGGDITEMDPDRAPPESRRRARKLLLEVFLPLASLEKPVLAAVNGHAYGAGCSLAIACDIVFAGRSAQFSFGFTRMGLIPDGGALFFLPRLVGVGRAKELILTARSFGADEAHALGLVHRVVDDDHLAAAALEQARLLANGPSVALGLAKRLLDHAFTSTIEQVAELEAFGQALSMSTDDHREAVSAFLERREAHFSGR